MLGGGIYVTQNKKLPGSYINVIATARVTSGIGERGTVAIALPIGKEAGKVFELTASDFVQNCETLLGVKYGDKSVLALREIFVHANKVYLYDLGTGGAKTVSDAMAALEPYDFNVACVYGESEEDASACITRVKAWRDDQGKKCQAVVYNATTPNHEGVINVVSTVSDADVPSYALVAWVAGVQAGCPINESCTNALYDGELTIVADKTQSQLEACLDAGQFVFHNVYGQIRVLEDINSLTEFTNDKGEDFKYNQTIRVVDQIANDIAKLFNTKYLGKIPNNASGRVTLWGDIVKHHQELERINAIENFDPTLVTVEQGASKKAVVVNDVITVTNCMAQLYMTIVVQ